MVVKCLKWIKVGSVSTHLVQLGCAVLNLTRSWGHDKNGPKDPKFDGQNHG